MVFDPIFYATNNVFDVMTAHRAVHSLSSFAEYPAACCGENHRTQNSSPSSLHLIRPEFCGYHPIQIDAELSSHRAWEVGHVQAPVAHGPVWACRVSARRR